MMTKNTILASIAYWLMENGLVSQCNSYIEKLISLDAFYSFMYYKNFCTKRFVLGEEVISKDIYYSGIYRNLEISRRVRVDEFIEAEKEVNLPMNYLNFTKHHLGISHCDFADIESGVINSVIVTDISKYKKGDIIFIHKITEDGEDIEDKCLVRKINRLSSINHVEDYMLILLGYVTYD